MKEHRDVNEGDEFVKGRPTAASIEEYIHLPATVRLITIRMRVRQGGLFRKENKVILATSDTPKGAFEGFLQTVPTGNIFVGAAQMKSLHSSEKERKGPAEDILQCYTAYMKKILSETECIVLQKAMHLRCERFAPPAGFPMETKPKTNGFSQKRLKSAFANVGGVSTFDSVDIQIPYNRLFT